MGLLVILGIAVGLAMDAFAVAVAASVTLGQVSWRQVFRFAFHFGLFQAVMPLIGWVAGRSVYGTIAAWDHWAAFGLLAFIGGKAIITALRTSPHEAPRGDPTRGWTLVMLSVATSIDALAVGLSLGVLQLAIWYPALIIGVVTATLTAVGMHIGSRLGARFGRWTEIVGGMVLIGIGTKILIEHFSETVR